MLRRERESSGSECDGRRTGGKRGLRGCLAGSEGRKEWKTERTRGEVGARREENGERMREGGREGGGTVGDLGSWEGARGAEERKGPASRRCYCELQ